MLSEMTGIPSVSGHTTVVVTGTIVVCGDDPGALVEPVLEPVPVVPRQTELCEVVTRTAASSSVRNEVVPDVWLTSRLVEVMIIVVISVVDPLDGEPIETVVALGVLLPVDDAVDVTVGVPVVTIVGAVVGV